MNTSSGDCRAHRSARAAGILQLPVLVLALAVAGSAQASRSGISGYSTPTSGPLSVGCSECHGGAGFPTSSLAIIGNVLKVNPGTAGNPLAIQLITTAGFGGFNLSASGGVIVNQAGEVTRLTTASDAISGELTHAVEKARQGPTITWLTQWNAPAASGVYDLAACALPVDGNGDTDGDGPTVCTSASITVNAAPVFDSPPVTSATEDVQFSYNIVVSDVDDPTNGLGVSVIEAPDWLLPIVPNTDGSYTLTGTPTNADVGSHAVRLRVSDPLGLNGEQAFDIEVANVNDPPVITSVPDQEILQNAPYRYQLIVDDPDPNETLTITAPTLPDWLQLQVSTTESGVALLSGTPGNDQVGLHDVAIVVTDSAFETATQNFTIDVVDVNDAPVFASVPSTAATEDTSYTYQVSVQDIDVGDTLILTAPTRPAWLSLTVTGNGTAILGGTPGDGDVGEHAVVLRAADRPGSADSLFTEQSFTIAVTNVNDPPRFASAAVTGATQGSVYHYVIATTDPDPNDTLGVTARVLPGWLDLTDNGDGSASLQGTPGNDDIGSHDVILRVTDAEGLFAEQNFEVAVANLNDAPSFTSAPDTAATENIEYRYVITLNDPDAEDTLTLTATRRPAWLTLNRLGPGTASLSGTPGNAEVGIHDVSLRVTDSGGLVAEQGFRIVVANVNDPPAFSSPPVLGATQDSVYTYLVTATDIDAGDVLTISADSLPDWLTLTGNGDGRAVLQGTPGPADVGEHAVALRVSDNLGEFVLQSFTIDVGNTNDAPAFTSEAVTSATQDALYRYAVAATDDDIGDTLVVRALLIPGWMLLDDAGDGTATLEGTPGNADVGEHFVVLQVSDAANLNAVQSFTVKVDNVNDPPRFLTEPPTLTQVGRYEYSPIRVTDPDVGDQLSLTATLPSWLVLGGDVDSGFSVTGQPTVDDVGTTNIQLRVEDAAGAFALQDFTLNVVSEPPVIDSEAVTEAILGQNYLYQLRASDADIGDRLVVTAPTLPAWLSLTDTGDGSAELSGLPGGADLGEHPVILRVTDLTGKFVEQAFVVRVGDGNLPPVADAGPDRLGAPGQQIRLSGLNSFDPDGVIESYLWTRLGSTAADDQPVAESAEALVDLPQSDAPVALRFRLSVVDDGGLGDSDSVIVNVSPDAVPPVAEAGVDRSVALDAVQPVFLSGDQSSDSDGGIVAYTWRQTDGPPVTLSATDIANTSFQPVVAGSYQFELTVTDDSGLQHSDRVRVTLFDRNPPPLLQAQGPDAPVAEGSAVRLSASAQTDATSAIARLRWRQTAGPEVVLSDPVAVNKVASETTFVVPPIGGDTRFGFEVEATDGRGLTTRQALVVDAFDNGIIQFGPQAWTFRTATGQPAALLPGPQGAPVWLEPLDDVPTAVGEPPSQLPFGLIELRLRVESSAVYDLGLLFPQAIPNGFGFFVQDPDLGWVNLSVAAGDERLENSVVAALTRGDSAMDLLLEDGGVGDADGEVNGRIVIVGGLGLSALGTAPPGTVPVERRAPDTGGSGAMGLPWALLAALVALLRRRGRMPVGAQRTSRPAG